MSTPVITRTKGTGSLASKPQQIDVAERDADLVAALVEHARLAFSTSSVVDKPLIMQIDRSYHIDDDRTSDTRWSELLHDSRSFDLLDRMAAEALAEDDAGLTLDLDELLS